MLLSQLPTKFQVPFASGAGGSFISQPLPVAAQPNGRASLTTGFSELNFDPLASGGIPPWGKDFNGILYQITAWLQWISAGGYPIIYDATFSGQIGGYPQYALLRRTASNGYWISTVDNNLSNPDTGGAGWQKFPDVIVQRQAGNYGVDVGSANAYRVTFDPLPASLAAIVGSPIRVRAAAANTIINPTIQIDNVAGDLPVPMINANGSNLLIGQIARANQIFEGFLDGLGFFQVAWPPPLITPTSVSPVVTGVIYQWSSELVPTWGLECNGQLYPIVSYPALFNVIGTRYGGDGATTFAVPDLRGAFVRGWDHGRGLDPNATTRTGNPFPASASVVGDHVGSWERASINAKDMNGKGTKILIVGDLDPFGTVLPLQAMNTKISGTLGNWPPNTWPPFPLGPPVFNDFFGGLSSGDRGQFYPRSSVGDPGDSLSSHDLYGIEGNAVFDQAGNLETRPLNINLMHVIAY